MQDTGVKGVKISDNRRKLHSNIVGMPPTEWINIQPGAPHAAFEENFHEGASSLAAERLKR
jgi:hypothetical protein